MPIDHTQWATPRTFVHTFQTGRSAELRDPLSVSELVRSGAYTDSVEQLARWVGGLTPADQAPPTAILVDAQDIVVEAMLVDPRVSRTPDDAAGVLPIGVLEESEVEEVVMLAFGGRERLDAFRRARAAARPDRAPDQDTPLDAPAEQPRRPPRRPGRARTSARA